jgi:hypothetical protein
MSTLSGQGDEIADARRVLKTSCGAAFEFWNDVVAKRTGREHVDRLDLALQRFERSLRDADQALRTIDRTLER